MQLHMQSLLFLDFVCCTLPGGAPAIAELDPARESHSKQLTDEQVVQKLPEELQRQSLSGSLPVSLQALRVGLLIRSSLLLLFIYNALSC